ncbi:MAG: alpha/beta fold hydrolase [Gammaproteobacteria bacterium]|nr:alpha/beta fold hydrolase [Gammaproteobacteria bacterium]
MPFVQNIVAGLGLGYLVACIALFLMQDSILFLPNEDKTPVEVSYQEYKLPLAKSGRIASRGYLVNAEAEGPVIVFFTGGFKEARNYIKLFNRLGYPAVIGNYRGFGKSDGHPSGRTLVRDAKLLIEWVRGEFPSRQVILMGYSMGSGVAILASDSDVDGLILVSPYRSLVHIGNQTPARFFPLRLIMRTKLDVRSQLDSLPERVLVLYSTSDTIIPPEETRHVLERIPHARVIEETRAHEQLLAYRETSEKISNWINSHFQVDVNDKN